MPGGGGRGMGLRNRYGKRCAEAAAQNVIGRAVGGRELPCLRACLPPLRCETAKMRIYQ